MQEALYEFDSANRLAKVSRQAVTEYQYDGLGNRIQNTVTEDEAATKDISYVIDPMSEYGDIIMATDSLQQKESSFVYGNGLILVTGQEDTAYYQLDSQYSVRGLSNEKGEMVTRVRYDEFGTLQNPAEAHVNGNIFSYTGHIYDESTGLYYAKARYYDSRQGRMASLDPIKDGENWYIYCYNNPITYVDPSGNVSLSEGTAAHKQIQLDYKSWVSKNIKRYNFRAYTEFTIPAGIPWSDTGMGRADIVGVSYDYGLTEVYEIKPMSYYNINSGYNIKGKNQLRGYISAIKQNFSYPNVKEGKLYAATPTMPFSLNPQRTLKVYTAYSRDPGMIYYDISKPAKKKDPLIAAKNNNKPSDSKKSATTNTKAQQPAAQDKVAAIKPKDVGTAALAGGTLYLLYKLGKVAVGAILSPATGGASLIGAIVIP